MSAAASPPGSAPVPASSLLSPVLPSPAPAPLLTATGLVKTFGGYRAVDDCTLSVARGRITGLIGPNGAGKTTLFNLLAGALPVCAGRITLDGEDITALAPHRRFARGLLRTFQIPHEFARLSTLDNLLMVPAGQAGERLFASWLQPARVAAQEAGHLAQAREVLAFLGLDGVAQVPAGQLSGGQKKLLELGRTLMAEPRLVLLDEPAAGVNRTLLRSLEAHIRALNRSRGLSFLIIEHDMALIEALCDEVVCMADGRVLTRGSFAEVRRHPQVLSAYLGNRVGDSSATLARREAAHAPLTETEREQSLARGDL